MGLDPLSVTAPARVKVLLLPVAHTAASRFSTFVGRLRQEDVVRLGDVSPDGRPHRTMFSPLAFPAGSVLYDLSTSTILPSHATLYPFEIYREPLVILGVADGLECCIEAEDHPTRNGVIYNAVSKDEGADSRHQSLLDALERITSAHPRALVHQILIFDHAKPNLALPEGMVIVPKPEDSKTTTIKTIMCDLTSQLLGEMAGYAKSVQALPSIESPRSTLIKVALSSTRPTSAVQGSRSASPTKNENNSQSRMSTPMALPSDSGSSKIYQSQDRALSPPSRVASPATTFDEIAGSRRFASPSFQTGKDSRHQSIERLSVQGFGSGGTGEKERLKGKGRIGVIVGALYLLAGRWPDAMKELVESTNISKANSDYVWVAKASDYIIVTLLMYAWAGMDFKVPQSLYPGIDRTSSGALKGSNLSSVNSSQDLSAGTPSRLVSMQNLSTLLPDLINHILNLYVRAWTFTDDKIPTLAYSESVIRFSKLLSIICRSHGSLDEQGLQRIVRNTKTPKGQGSGDKAGTFPSKAEIAMVLFRAFPGPGSEEDLPVADRTVILAGISSVLSDLGYHRKKALVLKELASALLPALVQARKEGAAEMGVHPAASLIALSAAVGHQTSKPVDGHIADSEHGMRDFLALICKEYGIMLPTPTRLEDLENDVCESNNQISSNTITALQNYDSDEIIIARAVEQASISLLGAQQLKLDVLRACINICEALPDLGGVLRFSADTLRTAGSGVAPGPESDNGSPALPLEDQVRLANNISRTLSASQQLGAGLLEGEYWDEFIVRGIDFGEINPTKRPIPHAKAELAIVHTTKTQAVKTPFIHNPFGHKTASTSLEPIFVAGEDIMFRVTLQNLYDFDLEVEALKLESKGVFFESLPISTTIGPYRTQTMGLKGIPSTAGSLIITGCVAKIKGCRERRFPLFAEPWSLKLDARTTPQKLLESNVRRGHTSTELQENAVDIKSYGPRPSSLHSNIIDSQPNVVLKSISLPQSAAMLLEGETKIFTVTLQNLSPSVTADLVLISFKDSTASQLQSALANKALTPAELYELEFSAAHSKSFKLLQTDLDREPTIAPGGTLTFSVEMFGRPGLSHGTIQIDFAHLGVSRSEVPSQFYTRQLQIPLAVTVNASVDLIRNDLIPFTSNFAWQNQRRQSQPPSTSSSSSSTPEHHGWPSSSRRKSKDDNQFASLLSRLGLHSQDQQHVLLLLDLRNSWPNLLHTSIQVRQTSSYSNDQPPIPDVWKRAYTVHETQQPGHTSRLVLIIPRLYVSNPHAPIPSLNESTKRQFVVSASREASAEVELAAREAFWYREELLKHICASWREDSTGRSGSINIRSLRLSTRMISALKLEDLAIRFSVHPSWSTSAPATSGDIKQTSLNCFAIPTSTFVTLQVHLRNRSSLPIHPLLRLQPLLRYQPHNIALDLSKKLIWNGLLQRVLPVMGAKETRDVDIGICALSEGHFEIGAVVEEVKVLEASAGNDGSEERDVEDAVLKGWREGKRDRRVWYSDEPCVLIAKELPAEDG